MIDSESLRTYVLGKPSVTEGFPFGETVLVFKADNRIFLLLSLDAQPLQFNVKCDPEWAVELRETYPEAVLPGYHMNKKHWNTVIVDGTVNAATIYKMIDHSYELVVSKGKRKQNRK